MRRGFRKTMMSGTKCHAPHSQKPVLPHSGVSISVELLLNTCAWMELSGFVRASLVMNPEETQLLTQRTAVFVTSKYLKSVWVYALYYQLQTSFQLEWIYNL